MADQIKCVFNVSDLMGDLRAVQLGQKIQLIQVLRTHLGGGTGPDGQRLEQALALVQAKGLVDEFSRILSHNPVTENYEDKIRDLEARLKDSNEWANKLDTRNRVLLSQTGAVQTLLRPALSILESTSYEARDAGPRGW